MAKSRARKLADIIVGAGVDINGNLTFDGGSTSEDLTFADGDKANFGDASDLQIYHDGSNSYIKEGGTGDLNILSSTTMRLQNASGTNYLYGTNNGEVVLYHNGTPRLYTTAAGINVASSMTATSAIVDNVTAKTSSGSITFKNNSGSDKMRLTDAGNLGIGTNSPAANLHVKSASNVSTDPIFRIEAPIYPSLEFYSTNSNSNNRNWKISSVYNSYGTLEVLSSTSAGGAPTTTRLAINKDGNVGTVASPQYPLDLRNPSDSNQIFRVLFPDSSTVQIGTSRMGSGNTQAVFLEGQAGLRFGVSGTEYARLHTNGKFGIGTTAPSKLLHLSESADGAKLRLTRGGVSEWDFSIGNSSTLTGVGSGALEILPQNSGTANEVAIGIAGSSSPLVHITNSQNYFLKKIGIGTTTPSGTLHVKAGASGASSFDARYNLVLEDDGENYIGLYAPNNSFAGIRFVNASSSLRGYIDYYHGSQGDKMHLYAQNSIQFDFPTTGTAAIIKQDGKVGIGTTSPLFQFHVDSGTTDVTGYFKSSDNKAAILIADDDTNTYVSAENSVSSFGSNAGINANNLNVTSAGRVGIGVTSPSAIVEIKDAAAAAPGTALKVHSVQNSAAADGLVFIHSEQSLAPFTALNVRQDGNGDILNLLDGTTEVFTVVNGGNVGIGSTSPNSLLQLLGPGSSGSTKTTIGFGAAGWGGPLAPNAALDGGVKLALFEGGTQKVQIGMDGNARLWLSSCGSGANGVDIYTGSSNSSAPSLRFRVDSAGLTNLYAGLSVTGNLVVDTSTFAVDSTNDRVGIGTTSPSEKLEVNAGNIRITNATGGSYFKAIQTTNGANAGYYMASGSSNWYTLIDTAGRYQIYDGDAAAIRVLVDGSGNVGINSTTPNQKLYVNGIIGSVNEAQGSGQLQLQGYGNSGYINMNGSGSLFFRMGSSYTTLMTLTAAGRLGIGTTAPSNQFVVKSGTNVDMEFGSEASGGFIQTYNRSTPGYGYLRFITNGETMRLTNTGRVGIGTNDPGTLLQLSYNGGHTSGTVGLANSAFDIYNPLEANTDEKGSILTFSDNYYSSGGNSYHRTTRAAIKGGTDTAGNTADGFLAFYTDSGAANTMPERMRINHDGSTIINSTSPFLIGGTARLSIYDSSVILSAGLSGSDMFYIRKQGTAAFAWQTYNGNNGGQIELQPYGGSVGIGTTSPTGAKLHVAGGIKGTDLIAHDSTGINLQTDEGTKRLVVTDAGNIGIGTTAPQALLHLNSGTDTYFIIGTTNGTADGRIQFRNSAGTDAGGLWYNTSGNKMMFRTNSTERMHINSGGQIGIGTTSVDTNAGVEIATVAPNTGVTTLRLTNAVNNKGQRIDFEDDNANRCFTLSHDNGSNITYMGSLVNESFSFYTNSTERMRITADGYLLVGKTNTTFSNAGIELRPGNLGARFIRSNAEPIIVNRTGNDGKVIGVYGQGTEVGSLFANAGSLVVKGASTSAPVQLQTHDGNEDIEVDPDGFIKFETAGSEQMRITDTGAIHCKEKSNNGDYTMYIGSINPAGSGNRYAHVQINTDGGEMFWVEAIGYDYIGGDSIYGRGGGYVYNYANQTDVYADALHGDIVALHQNTSGRVEIVIDLSVTQTNNRWGSVVLRGGCDTITTSAPLEIIQYSYTSTTTKVY